MRRPAGRSGRAAAALVIMVISLVLALARFGHDRRTLEKHIYYSLLYLNKAKFYSYFRRSATRPSAATTGRPRKEPAIVTMAWDDLNIYILMTVWLAVIGIYYRLVNNSGHQEGVFIQIAIHADPVVFPIDRISVIP